MARVNSFSKAAAALRKDRKTVSEHIENFEIDLGYPVFTKTGKVLSLTDKGEMLYRRAQLLWADVSAFERFATSLHSMSSERISICFDESIPAFWLKRIQASCHDIGVSVDLLKISREHGETLLRSGACQFGLFLAKGQVINAEFYWKALPHISMSAFARSGISIAASKLCTLRDLAKYKQRVFSTALSAQYQYPLMVSDDFVIENDLDILLDGLASGDSWAFLPNHLSQRIPEHISRINLDIAEGSQALQLQPVLIWASSKPPLYDQVFEIVNSLHSDGAEKLRSK